LKRPIHYMMSNTVNLSDKFVKQKIAASRFFFRTVPIIRIYPKILKDIGGLWLVIDLRASEIMFCPELRRIWARIQGVGSFAYQDMRDFP